MYKKIIPLLLLYFIYYDCYSQAILNPPSVIPKDVIRTNTLKAGTNIVITYQGSNVYINTLGSGGSDFNETQFNTNSSKIVIKDGVTVTNLTNYGILYSDAGINAGIRITNLTGNITLRPGIDPYYNYINPNGAIRTIDLGITAKDGDTFLIKHIGDVSDSNYLQVYDVGQGVVIDYLYSGTARRYVYYNSSWHSVDDPIINEPNIAIGHNAKSYNYGTVVGYQSSGYGYGTAMGYGANGADYGTAVGRYANGTNSGAAMGYVANGSSAGAAVGAYVNGANSGSAIGYAAKGANYGAAVGRSANGTNSGAAMGYGANGSSYGAAVGRSANGSSYGAAVGINANGTNYGVAVGCYANGTNSGAAVGCDAKGANYSAGIGYATGYRIVNGKTNILIGNIAGYNEDVNAITNGNYNLLIGNGAGLPSDCSYYLNIGNAIFGTNVQTKTGTNIDLTTKIGIATNNPHYTLEVHGDIGLGQNGNLYKGGEKLGWYSTGTFSQYGTTSITFPVTNAVYKIEGWGQAQSNDTNITASSAGIYYGASDTQDKIVNICMASASSDQAKLPFYFADIVEVNLESERVNYWKIKASGGGGVTVWGYYILTRIR